VQSGVGELIAPIVQACEEVAGNRGAGLDFQYRKERGSVERRPGSGCRGSGEGGLAGLPGAGDDDGVGGEALLKERSEETRNGMLRQRRRHRD
jgi:hypothetical protein